MSAGEEVPFADERFDECRCRGGGVPADDRFDVGVAELAVVRVARLGQAVRVEEQALAAFERAVHLLPLHPGLHAERIRAAADAVDDFAVGDDLQDLRMTGDRRDERAVAAKRT